LNSNFLRRALETKKDSSIDENEADDFGNFRYSPLELKEQNSDSEESKQSPSFGNENDLDDDMMSVDDDP